MLCNCLVHYSKANFFHCVRLEIEKSVTCWTKTKEFQFQLTGIGTITLLNMKNSTIHSFVCHMVEKLAKGSKSYRPWIKAVERLGEVHIFWEGYKILRNLHLTFDCSYCRGCQKFGIKGYWKLQFLGYLRTLSLKLQKARTKIEVVLTLPCWLSQLSLLKF